MLLDQMVLKVEPKARLRCLYTVCICNAVGDCNCVFFLELHQYELKISLSQIRHFRL
jgi:hypothetical protein